MNKHGPNRHSRAVIDLNAIRHNYSLLKQISGNQRLIAVVKADAYGHGAIEVAKALPKADAFAVAAVGEAVALRQAGIRQKILVLGGFIRAEELSMCMEYSLDPVIHQFNQLGHLVECSDLNGIDTWIKIDSGMGRLGYQPDEVSQVLESLKQLSTIGQIRLMTHLASADDVESDFSRRQIETVNRLGLGQYEWGIANSAGILGLPESQNPWVRAGIAMYGADPMSDRNQTNRGLISAMRMTSRLLAVNKHRKGDVIGYSNTYRCPRDMSIAVVATGYADGYPRHKVGTAQLSIRGQLCDIVGRISMDMITVDVSHLDQVEVDDEVILFGDSPDANQVADWAQTIAYEVLCNVGAHVQREYIDKA